MNSKIACCLHKEPVVNSIHVEIGSIVQQNGTLNFIYNRQMPDNLLVTDNISAFEPNDRLFFNLFSEDISLSLARIEGISAQNQLEGVLIRMKHENQHIICLVDVGFQLLIRITSKQLKNFNSQ